MSTECVNCKVKLTDKNTAALLFTGATNRMCTKCFGKLYQNTHNGKIDLKDFNASVPRLRALGFSESGIEHIRQYAQAKYMPIAEKIAAEKAKAAADEAAAIGRIVDRSIDSIKANLENQRRIRQGLKQHLNTLKEAGMDGYYEYKVISLQDNSGFFNSQSGRVNISAMTTTLNELGLEGWHLVSAYTNEAGKNLLSLGGIGTNSTIDENILIFERYVKIETI